MATVKDLSLKNITQSIGNAVEDVLANSDFISRTIGMNNSYEDIMFIVQMLGREPVSLLGKNYAFIYDHVRRNYMQGMDIPSKNFDFCNKFTFYKEVPTVKFANPYEDPMDYLGGWVSNLKTLTTANNNTTIHYSESNDTFKTNKQISNSAELRGSDLENANPGTAHSSIESFSPNITTCDLIGKTNANFNKGIYQTLVARFHTNAQDSKNQDDPTQTANTNKYGQSHGRNLLKMTPSTENGYDNPYCRVWTYHHQYNQIKRQIRPILGEDGVGSQDLMESYERTGNYKTVGFRTSEVGDGNSKFDGGSKRLDDYGVLNYSNGTVNIAPTAKIKDYFEGKDNDYQKGIISTKKCMFSLENLAWRDEKSIKSEYDQYGLSPEQKGPLGGRIMWFPPYNLTFNEDVSVDWNSNKFIGRGENVYTYTNTERKGTLTFTLLIDHPSILDYWTGRDKNGKNQGITLAEGNSGGVDNINNQENTLLRFFAGCDILSAKPQLYRVNNTEPIKGKEPEEEPTNKIPPTDVNNKETKKIVAVLYYPNNYSGKDDRNGKVDPIWYLMNGVGTQKYVNPSTKMADDIPTFVNTPVGGDGVSVGGYEMSSIVGISNVNDNLQPNHEIIKLTYADLTSKQRKAQYLTTPNGSKLTLNYRNNTYDLAKIVGSEAMSLSNAYGENLTGPRHLWYRKRYYYRVDKAYENQDFDNPNSYIDGRSFGLNSSGYDEIRKHSKIEEFFGVPRNDDDKNRLVSFSDLFVALEGDNTVIESINKENVDLIREILGGESDKYSNVKLTFNGHASKQGTKNSNNDLAKNRALTLRNWINDNVIQKDKFKFGEPEVKVQTDSPQTNIGDVDDSLVKLWRSAAVIIEYDETVVQNAIDTEATKVRMVESDETISTMTGTDNKPITTVKTDIPNKETSKNNILTAYEWLHNTPEGKVVLAAHPELGLKGKFAGLSMKDIERITGKNYSNKDDWEAYDNSYLQDDSFKQGVVKRYDNEGEFFKVLTEEEPFLHHLITDKIKYFDPAFHSISPEGFNARLTFLHQCTRQGSTVGNSDGGVATTAYNLAFGRPPVCVLRLGDFYNTKIIISSLSIQYENAQWDMNPEGIGMMPMFANITIGFTFLGGSDLAGPISRLQNAVSFNYYANTSVYDNRAEMVEYDSNGSGKETKFKGYNYPNDYVGNRLNRKRIGEKGYAEEF